MTVGVAARDPWGLVVVRGPDATSFLQSLVSQDLDPIAVGASAASMLLTPQGKLDVLFRITRVDDSEWWLDTEPEFGPRLAASLTRFRIRVDAEIEDRTADTALLTFVGGDAPAVPGARRLPGALGEELLGPRAEVLAAATPTWTAAQLEARRIEQGVPRLGVDVDESTIPQEAFLDVDAVSFTKGCFLGQELVTRIDTRGHVNKYVRRLAIEGDVEPPPGAEVVHDTKVVGAVTSSATTDDGRVVALATVRREVDPPAAVTVRWPGGETRAGVLASQTPR